MSKRFGFDLLRRQVLDAVDSHIDDLFVQNEWTCESEIERLFLAALICRLQYAPTEFNGGALVVTEESRLRLMAQGRHRDCIFVQPQVQIEKWRVDFVVYAWTAGTIWRKGTKEEGEPRWRRLIVECDGHDFHERTKEQASRDRSRDRSVSALGYEIFRFTGSEIWRDPWGCADQVASWAVLGV